jgi:hypothetical protein
MSYEGEWLDNLRHGKGLLKFFNNQQVAWEYSGQFSYD